MIVSNPISVRLNFSIAFIFISLIVKSIVAPRELDLSVASKDLLIYKDQLVEVEKDLEKGVLSIAESEAAKIEVTPDGHHPNRWHVVGSRLSRLWFGDGHRQNQLQITN